MLHQSKIRKSALSLIYAVLEQGSTVEEFPFRLFWEIALEKDMDHYRQALTKGILHVCRASAELAGQLIERGEALLLEPCGESPSMELLTLREDVERCVERTKALQAALTELRICLNDKRRDSSAPLEERCRHILQLVQTLCALGDSLLPKLEDAHRPAAESMAGALRRWLRTLRECARLASPLTLEDSEYAGLVRKARALDRLRPEAEELAREVLARRDEWEAALHRLLRNYVPERLDTVDKSILYLSLYELQCRKLEVPIAISEAINLAHEFSGAKSAPFIHGILAAAVGEMTENA